MNSIPRVEVNINNRGRCPSLLRGGRVTLFLPNRHNWNLKMNAKNFKSEMNKSHYIKNNPPDINKKANAIKSSIMSRKDAAEASPISKPGGSGAKIGKTPLPVSQRRPLARGPPLDPKLKEPFNTTKKEETKGKRKVSQRSPSNLSMAYLPPASKKYSRTNKVLGLDSGEPGEVEEIGIRPLSDDEMKQMWDESADSDTLGAEFEYGPCKTQREQDPPGGAPKTQLNGQNKARNDIEGNTYFEGKLNKNNVVEF